MAAQPDTLQAVTVVADRGVVVSRTDTVKLNSTLNVASTLQTLPGLYVGDYGGYSGLKSASLRGFGSAHTAIYVDGVRVGNVQSGQADLGNLDIASFGSIVADYAQNSLSFITARPVFHNGPVTGTVSLQGGSFGTWKPYGNIAFRLTPKLSLSTHVGGLITKGAFPLSDGTTWGNNDMKQIQAGADLFGLLNGGDYHAKVSYNGADRGTPGSISWPSTDRQKDKNLAVQGLLRKTFGTFYTLNVSTKLAFDNLYYFSEWGNNQYNQTEFQLNTAHKFRIKDWWTVTLAEDLTYDFLGKDLQSSDSNAGAYSKYRLSGLTAVGSAFHFNRFKADIALEYAYIMDQNASTWRSLSPSVDLRFTLVEGLDVVAFGRRAYRTPTFNELYYPGYGNPDLKPEDAWLADLGFDFHRTLDEAWTLAFKLDGFYNKLKDNVWSALGATKLRRGIQKRVKNIKRAFIKTSEVNSFFDSLGFRYFGPIDGNDVDHLVTYLTRLKAIKGPKLLHVITTKGAGYKPAEDNPTVWHAPGQYDPTTGETIKQDDKRARYQDVFGTTVTRLAVEDKRIVGITPAMLSGSGLSIMHDAMPDRVFDVGIAEGHAVTFSAGLAAGGMLPFCCIYSSFMQRAYDNVIHDVALQNLKVIFCLDRAGLVGEDGATHHGVFDLAAFRPVPNLAIASPRNELELANLLYSATCEDYPATIIRYPRGRGIGTSWKDEAFGKIPLGKAELLHNDSNATVAVLSIGPVADKCRQAIELANEKGVGVIHYDMRFLKPLDVAALDDVCSKVDAIITVEDACKEGGLHGAVAEYVADRKPACRVESLGVPDEFISQGTREQLFDFCGYNTDDIFKAIMAFHKK